MSRTTQLTGHGARILIVDDERDNRELLGVILGHEGFVVTTTASGEEALVVLAHLRPDLVLLDVMMPGMDGYEVARKIKDDPATRAIRIVMMSALDDRNARTLAANAGADAFLSKSMRRAELCAAVRAQLATVLLATALLVVA